MSAMPSPSIRRRCLCLALASAALAPGQLRFAHAQDAVRIRLATLAPRGSSYHRILLELGERWKKAQEGGASFTVFTDGTQGGEADAVRRMRVGQLNAGLLSVVGLLEIDRAVSVLQQMPLVYRDWQELDYVRDRLAPTLERRFRDKGFEVLFWGDGGWVRFFSSEPAATPQDFKRMRMFVWAGDQAQVELMKRLGYQPVPIETADILPGLQTGLIDAVPATPFFALAGQFNGPAPHMLDIKWAPIVGACVVTAKVWDAMSPVAREELKRASAAAAIEVRARARSEDLESIEAMKRRGLKVTTPTPQVEAQWRAFADSVYPALRGRIVPEEAFDEVMRLLAEHRAQRRPG
jgi:TRAP-type C4-dicarboxylate transport system substrate-binding protein